MEYIIKSDSYRLLKNKINELTKNIDKDNITYFDLTIDNLSIILEECNYSSLFCDKKAIIVYNTNIFGTKYEYMNDLELLEKYLNNQKVKEYINNLGFKIENNVLNDLINNLNKNYDYILNEIDKVSIIKEDKIITKEDINKYTIKLETDILFDFVDAIIKKEEKKVYNYMMEYIKENKEPAILFSNIASQYRLIYSVKNLIKEGYRETEIATLFKIHEYRVKLAHDKSYNYTNEELKNKLLLIGKLDEKIKTGHIDKYSALKYFLTSL